jgi:hypothetical protein
MNLGNSDGDDLESDQPVFPVNTQIVSPEQFDKRFNDEANIADFASDQDESDYVERDSFLVYLIKREVQKHFGSDAADSVHILEDWWPNHTRYLDMTPLQCTPAFLIDVHTLLVGDFSDYRVQICVYGDILAGASIVGAMVMYTNRIVIEQRLYDVLMSRNDR